MQSLFEAVNLKPMEQVLNRILIMTILSTVYTHAEKNRRPLGFKELWGALKDTNEMEVDLKLVVISWKNTRPSDCFPISLNIFSISLIYEQTKNNNHRRN